MMPPEVKDGKLPFIMYNYGGEIMNLIVAGVGILLNILMESMPIFISAILILMSTGSIYTAMNIILHLDFLEGNFPEVLDLR